MAAESQREARAEAVGAPIAAAFGEFVPDQPSNKRRKLTPPGAPDGSCKAEQRFRVFQLGDGTGLAPCGFLVVLRRNPMRERRFRRWHALGKGTSHEG